MAIILPFGKHKGKTIEWVGVNDYSLLLYYLHKGIIRQDLRERAEEVRYALNNFTSILPCAIKECKTPASYISVILANSPHDGRPFGISVSPWYIYCDNKEHYIEASIYSDGKSILHPIEFDTLLEYPHSPKWIRRSITDVLLQCAGLGGRKNQKRLESFIDDILLSASYSEEGSEKTKRILENTVAPKTPTQLDFFKDN